MRRCLHAFLTGLLTLSLVTAPAHACWRSRQARSCRPVRMLPTCPPPAWCEPCDPVVVEVVECGPAMGLCCGETAAITGGAAAVEAWVVDGTERSAVIADAEPVIEESVAATQPETAPQVAQAAPSGLEAIVAPPALEPAGDVTPASNEQPLVEPPAEPASESVLAEPAMPADGKQPDAPPAADPEGVPPAPEQPEATLPDEPSADQPPMKASEADDLPAEPAPVEDEPASPVEPEPTPQPEPEEPNIFEELEAEEAEAADTDEEMPADSAAALLGEEPASGADPFGEDAPAAATEADEEMTEEASADAAEPAADEPAFEEESPEEPAAEEPMADEAEESPPGDAEAAGEGVAGDDEDSAEAEPLGSDAPEAPSEPDPEPVSDDPFVAAESPRRWIDATGTGSIVATLVDVAGDERCVLELRGRRIVVPLEKLSGHDRDYVRRAGGRLAELRGQADRETAADPAPAANDTAGL